MFQTLIVQPIYNFLVAIYGILPGHDLGISLILFTLFIRLLLWPLLRKQLHQSKVMRELQPELTKIKKAAGGDRQKEGRLMMELYKERGISPFGTIGLTLIQLPIFLGVFQAARYLTEHLDKISTFTYPFVREIPHISAVISDSSANFNFTSLGFIDLSQKAISDGAIYLPVFALAVAATVFQFIQSKQLIPQPKEKKRLRDILKNSAASGEQPAQEDISAAMGSTMLYLMPIMTILFAIAAQGAMVMYLLATSIIGIVQQTIIFRQDTNELEEQTEVVSVKKQPASAEPSKNEPVEKIAKSGGVVTKTRIITPNESSSAKAQSSKSKKKRRKR